MARGVFSTANYLVLSSGIITATPLSMSCRVFPTGAISSSQTLMGIFYTAGAAAFPDGWYVGIGSSDTVTATTADGTGANGSTSTGVVNLTAWNHVGAVFTSATNRVSYLNGVASTASTGNRTPSASPNKTAIGVRIEQNNSIPLSEDADTCYIAEVGFWNVALTASEMAILSLGFSPLFISPTSLVAYYPLIRGDASGDELSVKNAAHKMVEQGTLPIQPHTRIFLPS